MESIFDHIKRRHLNPDEHYCHISEEDRAATFLLWNLSGQLVGYQRYRPDYNKNKNNVEDYSRYYYSFGDERIPSDGEIKIGRKRVALWGVHTLHKTRIVFLSEGIFNAVRMSNMGFSSLATLTNDPQFLRSFLTALNRPLVSICDGDVGGKELAKFGHHAVFMPSGTDAGDLSDDEILKIVVSSVAALKEKGFDIADTLPKDDLPG